MIRTYGLHWHLSKIYWGQQGAGHAGSLLGAASRSPQARPVEFRDQSGIYALYADYDLVYIGQTGAGDQRLFARLKQHTLDHLAERWDRFSWFGTRRVTQAHELAADNQGVHVNMPVALNILEAVCIAVSEPRLNLQRGRWGEATQYFQIDAAARNEI